MIERRVRPRGRYRLALSARTATWSAPLPDGGVAVAWQASDGLVWIRSPSSEGLERARFMLALDDDTSEFERRFRRDPVLGPSVRALTGLRPLRVPTVAHAALRAVCGQLVESRRARALERAVLRTLGSPVATRDALGRLAPVELRRLGLAMHRACAIVRLCRSVDLERLRGAPATALLNRICRERGLGPWSAGVIALEGLGRYDLGLVGDLGLVKLASARAGRWVDAGETADLLAPYGEWSGLASIYLLSGWARGLVPGASPDAARALRVRRFGDRAVA